MVFHHESKSGAWLIKTNFVCPAAGVTAKATAPASSTAISPRHQRIRLLQSMCLSLRVLARTRAATRRSEGIYWCPTGCRPGQLRYARLKRQQKFHRVAYLENDF